MGNKQTRGVGLTADEIANTFSDSVWAEKYPPILNVEQAAELAGVPVATIYAWSSKEQLKPAANRVGKYLRIHRDRFVDLLFNQGVNS